MSSTASVAPGSVVLVRDEEWLVTSMEQTDDGQFLHVQGLSDLVRGTSASLYEKSEALLRERSLLYVAASRARDELVVTWTGPESPLLHTT